MEVFRLRGDISGFNLRSWARAVRMGKERVHSSELSSGFFTCLPSFSYFPKAHILILAFEDF